MRPEADGTIAMQLFDAAKAPSPSPAKAHHNPAFAACKKQADDQKLARGEARRDFIKNCMKAAPAAPSVCLLVNPAALLIVVLLGLGRPKLGPRAGKILGGAWAAQVNFDGSRRQ